MKDHIESHDSFDQLKLKTYQVGLAVGLTTVFLSWLFSNLDRQMASVNLWYMPILAVYCLVWEIVFWRSGVRYLHGFERSSFIIALIYFVLEYATIAYEGLFTNHFLVQKLLFWTPLLYVIAFLLFERKSALSLSALFLLILLAIGGFYLSSNAGQREISDVFLFMQIFLASLIYIVLLHFLALLQERYQQAESHSKQMSLLASLDPLTGIFNRRKIVALLEEMIEDHHRQGEPCSLLLLDVDHFKAVNDSFGHDVGDRVLQDFVAFLKDNLRRTDFIGRWGGDEFIILCPHSSLEETWQVTERIKRNFEMAQFPYKQEIGLSFGAAACREGDTVHSLIKSADVMLYRAKQGKQKAPRP